MVSRVRDVGLTSLRIASDVLTRAIMDPGGEPSEEGLSRAVAGKTVLVTGASHGIGKATALRLGRAESTVVLVARSADRLEEVAAQISERGGTPHVEPCDLADPDAAADLASRLLDDHGRVDIVVSNAGKSIRRSIELSYERFRDFERTMEINYLGPVRLLLGLLPAMRAYGDGQIVNVSTLGVRMPPTPRWSAYIASKAAFDVWVRSAATELRRDGVACTAIYFGLVHTRMSLPTDAFRYMPGLRAEQAGAVVARAIVERPRAIEPWWVTLSSPALAAARGPWEFANTLYFRLTSDTDASAQAAGTSDRTPAS